ncbi:MAG: type II toxin-antitoxin system RelE/ParE family toxin [Rhizobiaceae bacterium]|nr:type II toxin-antitoxin system RelE/ParE family toxin [Rhizobiaceae bacterium]
MGYQLSREAEEDIISIAEAGLRLFGRAQAQKYHDELFDLFDLIAANPHMARQREELAPPVRIHPFKAHLIIYITKEGGEVLIIRIRHGHEDWAQHTGSR